MVSEDEFIVVFLAVMFKAESLTLSFWKHEGITVPMMSRSKALVFVIFIFFLLDRLTNLKPTDNEF